MTTILSLILAVGSTTPPKVEAVKEIAKNYPMLAEAQVVPISVKSGVADQPLSLEETILGAKNRALQAFQKCDGCNLGFGIESGLMQAPGTQTGYLNISACSIYDGKNHHIGLSTGFEVPSPILKLVVEKKIDLNQACYQAGITDKAEIGAEEGLIGILTNGRVSRQQYSRECISTALIQLEHAKWFASHE
ncbi:MAG: inosine/xanthosine triphosphatase [Verrucomicrobia bacterium]|nr:inosine/xanthosine triphosphatase [Verrucomicrobiota bacterium]